MESSCMFSVGPGHRCFLVGHSIWCRNVSAALVTIINRCTEASRGPDSPYSSLRYCLLFMFLFYRWPNWLREGKQFALKHTGNYSKTDADTGLSDFKFGEFHCRATSLLPSWLWIPTAMGASFFPWDTSGWEWKTLLGSSFLHLVGTFFLITFIQGT